VVWQQLRVKGISVDFRRIWKFDSDLGGFRTYLVDLSIFEEESKEDGCAGVISEKYRRLDDGCLIVMQSINVSHSVNNREIEKELEKEVNLCHPCIAAPIGFIFPVESSELREMKIGQLSIEGHSLAEVVLVHPV
jgi:hypothetical protein